MKRVFFTLLAVPMAAYAAQPFLIFASDAAYSDPATLPLVQRYLSSTDYLGYRAAASTPQLKGIVPNSHLVEISHSIRSLEEIVTMGCDSQAPGIIYYQLGDPSINPANELVDPASSVGQAAAIVNSSGCHRMGLIPEGAWFNSGSCATDLDAGPYQKVDWNAIGFLDIPANGLMDACVGKTTLQQYVNFVRSIAAYVRQKNSKIVLTAHLSFGNTSPATMVAAAQQLGEVVDGLLVAYPLSPIHQHLYSSASNLSILLSSLRPR